MLVAGSWLRESSGRRGASKAVGVSAQSAGEQSAGECMARGRAPAE